MKNEIAAFFLLFSNDAILLPLIILGFIWLDRAVFYHATSLLLLSMLYGYFLKISFKIPLMPYVGKGYGFPSGHMLMSTAFYGWIAHKARSWPLRFLMLVILLGIGFGLYQFHFHQSSDIFAGFLAAVLLMIVYSWGLRLQPKWLPLMVCVLATVFLGAEYHIEGKILKRIWMAYYALVGFVLAGTLTRTIEKSSKVDKQIGQKVLATLLCLGGTLFVQYCYKYMIMEDPRLPGYITETQWFWIGYLIPFSVWVADNPIKRGY